ncbi:MAG: Mut7-C RNAse domain-containing protein [Anaerolineales bacterium]
MTKACLRFHADLNDFLPSSRVNTRFSVSLDGHPAVKDTIEALGVPHTEVDVILVNHTSVDFSYQIQEGDDVQVYPASLTPEVNPLIRLQPRQPRIPRFVLDTHLGKLAAYLRMLGFDTLYQNDYSDEDLAEISQIEDRCLLTRDRGLLKRSSVTRGYCPRSTNSRQQLIEVLQRYNLFEAIGPFQRCMHCNGTLESVSKEEIMDRLEPDTKRYYQDFFRCTRCGRIYWKGSHYQRMRKFIEQILEPDSH